MQNKGINYNVPLMTGTVCTGKTLTFWSELLHMESLYALEKNTVFLVKFSFTPLWTLNGCEKNLLGTGF